MRPIFCGNFEYDARQSDLERLFRKYGKVDRVDMKSGYAFIYMDDERDGEDAIRALDRKEFGRKGRRLRVEWTKKERGIKRPGDSRRSSTNTRPSKTLFVINFDPYHTRTRDLERHFDPYGKILNIRIRRNFAFIQYESLEDATKALDATNMSKLMDRVISVEYAIRDDDERRNGYSPDRSRDRSPSDRRNRDKGRSPSPYRRERASPDYGRGPSPSPYRRERDSPDYGRGESPRPQSRDRRSPSPYKRERVSTDYGRGLSPRPNPRESRSPSPYGREKRPNPQYGRGPSPRPEPRDSRSPSPYKRERAKPDYDHGTSPRPDPRDSRSPSPYRRDRVKPDYDRGSSPRPERADARSPSPYERERTNADYQSDQSPGPERKDSPNSGRDESPARERYRSRSRSPPARGRS